MKLKKNFTYIDLFAGIGGFHCAMDNVSNGNARCIFASEIDKEACKTYELNHKLKPLGDIRNIDPSMFEAPDVVCGGFPCQTFSKAGKQNGFKDPRGTLFREIIRIVEYYPLKKRPKILLLENVRNLISHDNGETWKTIKHEIKRIGYNVVEEPLVVSPKDVGVPQLRDRAIILAVRSDLYNKPINLKIKRKEKNTLSIDSILEDGIGVGAREITDDQNYCLDCWNDFINNIDRKIIGFPIWSDYFVERNKQNKKYPVWKNNFIKLNQELYFRNKIFIDKWLKKWSVREKLNPTCRKFEWQVNGKIDSVYKGIIQFRTSGIRIKQATESPALVAMVHLPIIGPKRRTISVKEAARLQSFPDNFVFNEKPHDAFKQLGNAVNVKVIETSFMKFIKYMKWKLED